MQHSLQENVAINAHKLNGQQHEDVQMSDKRRSRRDIDVDTDAQAMVITSLRAQIQDLYSQVSQLNSKLVASYDRVSDLEDEIHVASANVRSSSLQISQLELERTQHLAALNTGLLVEKSHVTTELNRLMERATEEAAQRGQAESARADIEKDLDDLSATLFNQANTMVAEARFAQAQSERKVEEAETALKGAEEAVALMQQQVQALQAEKEEAEERAEEALARMGKGKWVDKGLAEETSVVRLMSSHAPFQEFLSFVAHLRALRPVQSQTPAIATLLQQPFLNRLLTEDLEPTVRLDMAPSLNWLSRRSVLAAIHTGQLCIEPISFNTLLQELGSHSNIACALCGISLAPHETSSGLSSLQNRLPSHPLSSLGRSHSATGSVGSWPVLFKNPLSYSSSATGTSRSSSPITSQPPTSSPSIPQQFFIFRLDVPATNSSTTLLPLPLTSSASSQSSQANLSGFHSHSQSQSQRTSQSTIYPLCTSGWCLMRLRTTCSLWAFVRTGVVEKIWEEETRVLPPKSAARQNGHIDKSKYVGAASPPSGNSLDDSKPPIPPRRRGLWDMATALSGRAVSWGEGDQSQDKKKERDEKIEEVPKAVERPTVVEERVKRVTTPRKVRVPPPVHPSLASGTLRASSSPAPAVVPPPLPRRSESRGMVMATAPVRSRSPAIPDGAQEAFDDGDVANDETYSDDSHASIVNIRSDISENESRDDERDAAADEGEPLDTEDPLNIEEVESSSLHEDQNDAEADPSVPSDTQESGEAAEDIAPSTITNASQDSFSTPVEEISSVSGGLPQPEPDSPSGAEIKPTEVSLPPSRPVSPGIVPQQETSVESPPLSAAAEHTLPADSDESHTITADATPSATTIPDAKNTPVPTGLSAPPPLPRRAAARGLQSHPQSNVGPSDTAPEVVDSQLTSETPAVQNEQEKDSADAKYLEDEVHEPPQPEEGSQYMENQAHENPMSYEQQPAMEASRDAADVPADDESTAILSDIKTPTLRIPPPPPPRRVLPNPASSALSRTGVEEETVDSHRDSHSDDNTNIPYVGESTWEERTWKEVVRLKEEMFWARVGGVR